MSLECSPRLRTQGGLGLPDLWKYYQVAQLAQFSIIYTRGVKPDWVNMERQSTPRHTIAYFIWCPKKSRPPILAPTLSHSMALCDALLANPTLTSELRPLTYLLHNPLFPPGLDIRAFQWWLNKGLFRLGHFLSSMGPLTLNPLCTQAGDAPIGKL